MCSPQWPAGAVNWRGGAARQGSEKPGSEKQGMAHTSTSSQPASQQQQPIKKEEKCTQENAPEPACHSYAKTVAGSFDQRPSAAERASIGRGA